MNEIELTPKQIVAELDKYIVGQKEAKKSSSYYRPGLTAGAASG